MIMDSAKNGRWIIPFKKFGMVSVNTNILVIIYQYLSYLSYLSHCSHEQMNVGTLDYVLSDVDMHVYMPPPTLREAVRFCSCPSV